MAPAVSLHATIATAVMMVAVMRRAAGRAMQDQCARNTDGVQR